MTLRKICQNGGIFSVTRIFLYKDRIGDSVRTGEDAGQRKPAFWHSLLTKQLG